jgi:cobalt/nickel transport system permease protein
VAHIPDGFLSVPVLAGTAGASAAVLTVAVRRAREALGEREAPVLGAATAFIFAAQMLNFPLGIGASAHLLGGTLAAILFGPWVGMLVLFAVLLVQALLFQDGGIAALGANTLNMAVLGVGSGWLIFRWGQTLAAGGRRGTLIAAGIAAFCSTTLVGVAVTLELVGSGLAPFEPVLLLVGGGHVLVGIAEGALTAGILGMVLRTRPDLVTARIARPSGVARAAAVVATGALVIVLAAVAVASTQPDVLQTALQRLVLHGGELPVTRSVANRLASLSGAWAAGVVGLLAAFLVTWGVATAMARRRE